MTTSSSVVIIGVAAALIAFLSCGKLALAVNVRAGATRSQGGQQQESLVAGLSAADVTAVMQATSYLELSTDAQIQAYAQRKVDEQVAAGSDMQELLPMRDVGVPHDMEMRFAEHGASASTELQAAAEAEAGAEDFPGPVDAAAIFTVSQYGGRMCNGACRGEGGKGYAIKANDKYMKTKYSLMRLDPSSRAARAFTLEKHGFKILGRNKRARHLFDGYYWRSGRSGFFWHRESRNIKKKFGSIDEGKRDLLFNDLKKTLIPEMHKCWRKIGSVAASCEHHRTQNDCDSDAGGCQWNPVIDLARIDEYNTKPGYQISFDTRKNLKVHAALMRRSSMKVTDQLTQRGVHGGGSIQEKCGGKMPALGRTRIAASSAFFGVHIDFMASVLKNARGHFYSKQAFDSNGNSKGYFGEMMNFWGPLDTKVTVAPLGFVIQKNPATNRFQCPADNERLEPDQFNKLIPFTEAKATNNIVWANVAKGEGYLIMTKDVPHAALPLFDPKAKANCRTSSEIRFYAIHRNQPARHADPPPQPVVRNEDRRRESLDRLDSLM